MRHTVILDPIPGGAYPVTAPALPGCITEGATFEEAVANAREAIEGLVETLPRLGEPIPREELGWVVVAVDVESPVPAAVA